MKNVFLLLLTLFSGHGLLAQRYAQQLFGDIKKETVTYSEDRKLKMDVYQPVGDHVINRPLFIYVHGGGFAGGRRDEPSIVDFCKNLASRGYVVASLSYTLNMKGKSFGCDQPATNKLATFRQAGEEINLATKYFIDHRNVFGINPELIVLAGSSAGAEAVVHASFWPETQQALPPGFKFAGLISMAGAIYDLNLINANTAIPMMFFHGTCDNLVPYGTASHHYCKESDVGYLKLYGAASMVERLKELNVGYYLLTGCNEGHEWNSRPISEYQSDIANFILQNVMNKRFRQIHEIIRNKRSCKQTPPEVCAN
jgi:poly(3-hydroxybutyrate) depolymerase